MRCMKPASEDNAAREFDAHSRSNYQRIESVNSPSFQTANYKRSELN